MWFLSWGYWHAVHGDALLAGGPVSLLGGALLTQPQMDDRTLPASEVLAALAD